MNIYAIIDNTYQAVLSVFSQSDDAMAVRAFDAAVEGSKYCVELFKLGSVDPVDFSLTGCANQLKIYVPEKKEEA